ncbi:ATP-binding protein [Actinoplanes sp. NPDC089786]|uniref:ATP-binding protein n=1 Tax=Actinoplanes sp. NPDC089786 TaxID=3155185 RepID=UPI00343A1880
MRGDGSVRRLLGRTFALLTLLILGAGLAEMVAVLLQHRVVDQLSTHVQPLQVANAHLRGVLADAQRSLRGYLLTGDGQMLDGYYVARSDYGKAVDDVETLVGDREQGGVTTQLRHADQWWAVAERQRRTPPRGEAAAEYVTEGKPLFQAFAAANQELDLSLAARRAALQRRSARLEWLTVSAVAALTVIAAVTAAIAAARANRRITTPLGRLVEVLDRQRAGDHAARADPAAGPAEIRAVAEAINIRAEEADRARTADQDVARLRGAVRELGYRIRVTWSSTTPSGRRCTAWPGCSAPTTYWCGPWRTVCRRRSACTTSTGPAARWPTWPPVTPPGCAAATSGPPTTRPRPATCGRPSRSSARGGWAGDGPVLTVAVSGGDECIGALTLMRDGGPSWTAVETRLAEVVAADLGRGVHHARLYEHEQHLVARLQELDTAKTDFMSTVSHELRTPLTSISGYLELMLDAEAGELSDPQRRMLEVISRNTRRLRELIEDMLILSRIESGAFRISKRDAELAGLIDTALTAIEPAAAKASVSLHTEVAGPLALRADPEQIDRVLINLLTNAVKFTPPEGTVTVRATREDDEMVLVVADTGMGIPEAEQQALFARFFRATNAIHQAIPGTGLGLAIVRTIIDNHGGSISVTSTERVGTTVTVRLPVS